MPRRRFLTAAQQQRIEAPLDPEEAGERAFIRHYTLDAGDLINIRRYNTARNQVDFAVQLCYLRFPGRALRAGEKPPACLTKFVSAQLGLRSPGGGGYRNRDPTRREHLAKLRQLYEYRACTVEMRTSLSDWLLPIALKVTNGGPLIDDLATEMRRRRIILPTPRVLDEMASEVHIRARRLVYKAFSDRTSTESCEWLDSLLLRVPDRGETRLTWLRKPPGRVSSVGMVRLLDRLDYLHQGGVRNERRYSVHRNWLLALAREGRRASAQHLSLLEPNHRHASLVALLLEIRATLIDDLVAMHDRLTAKWIRDCKAQHAEKFETRRRDISEKAKLYGEIGRALVSARAAGGDAYAAIEEVLPWPEFTESVEEAAALAEATSVNHLALLGSRYTSIRRFSARYLAILEFRASGPSAELVRAVGVLRALNAAGKRAVPHDAPTGFVTPKWAKYVGRPPSLDRRYYEMCVLFHLRDRIRSGDISVSGSRRHRDLDDYLISDDEFQEMKANDTVPLSIEVQGNAYLRARLDLLQRRLSEVNAKAALDELEGVSVKGGVLRVANLENSVPEVSDEVNRRLYALLPRTKITDLLAETEAWVGFGQHFPHMRTRGAPKSTKLLLAAILADATNLGVKRMAVSCPGMSYRQVAWTADWHLREETYRQALATLVDAQRSFEMAKLWGAGATSSSDGQWFRTRGHGRAVGRPNAKYGKGPGIKVYTHISDQYSPFHVDIVDAHIREASYVIDGLTRHESSLEIAEHYTDTAGFTDHVFALCHLLGFRFVPRIRNIGAHKLYVPDKTVQYQALAGLTGPAINEELVASHWQEMVRLSASIKVGTVSASMMLNKLGGYPRKNRLAQALREFGHIERTLHSLQWYDDPDYRRRALAGLNKGEAKNKLSRAVFTFKQGDLRDRNRESQLRRISGLNFVIAAVVLWNTVYLERAVATLRSRGDSLPDDILRHVSPLGWDHINLTGDYVWASDAVYGLDALRPLES